MLKGEPYAIKRLKQRIQMAKDQRDLMRVARAVIEAGGGVAQLVALGLNEDQARDMLNPDRLGHYGMMVTISAGYVGRLERQLEAAERQQREKEARRGRN